MGWKRGAKLTRKKKFIEISWKIEGVMGPEVIFNLKQLKLNLKLQGQPLSLFSSLSNKVETN